MAIEPDQILVSTGAKHSLYNLFMALIDPGDEVLIPAPYWVSYPDMVMLAGGRPVILETKAEDDFAVTAAQVAAACSARTRAIVLNNPSNPTGAVYTRAQIEALAKVVVEKDLLVISDDIYRQLVYGDAEYVSIAAVGPEVAKRTVLVDGVSKTYAMTGWRIGYTAGPIPLIKAMSKIQGQSTSNPTHISQIATLAALTGPQDCVGTMRKAFDERRKRMVELLRAIPGVNCREPKGAFYAFPDVSAYVGKRTPEGSILDDDVQLCDWLVEVGKVAVVPGSGFGAPGFVRLSYACSMKNIEDGVGRLAKALGSLK
jgi:aspartate aminotransferase